MFGLLGPHCNSGLVADLVAAWKPAVATVVDPGDWSWEVAATPRTRFVWRWWMDDRAPDFNRRLNVAVELGKWLDFVLPRARPWMARRNGYIQGFNEPVVGSLDAMARLGEFEAERARLLARYGFGAALGSLAVGNPAQMSWWQGFEPAFAAGRECVSVLALHEYNWPRLSTEDEAWYVLRHRLLYDGCSSQGWDGLRAELRLPLIVSEAGLDGLAARNPADRREAGWNGAVSPEEYLKQLAWYDAELARDPYVLGACLYAFGDQSGRWALYEHMPEAAGRMAREARPVYRSMAVLPGPKPKPGPVAPPPRTMPKIVDVTGLLERNAEGLRYKRREMASIEFVVVHHSGSGPRTSPAAMARFHVRQRGWPGIGYHFVVARDGMVFQTNELTSVAFHAGTTAGNLHGIGVCLPGDFTLAGPPVEQVNALIGLLQWLGLPVRAHKELVGTGCPGDLRRKWWQRVMAEPREVGRGGV